jgi:phage baseplate assembly protein gpV
MPNIGRNIIPSSLGIQVTPRHHDGDVFDNTRLRMGEVKEIVYPNDSKSLSKKFVEYSVFVQHRGGGTGLGKMYYHCVLSSSFGGFADQCHYTFRVDASVKKGELGLGSKVLLLCINGEHSNAVIVGGLRDQSDKSGFGGKEAKDLGHYFHFNFNGVSADIDKDGQFTLVYNGATKIDGTTSVDSSKTGTRFQLDKEGNARLGDKDDKNLLLIDHANSKVVIKRDTAFELGEATDYMLLGQSFRQAQQQMNNQLLALLNTLKGLLTAVGTAMTAAGASMVTPIAGAVLAAPQFTAAGTALVGATQTVGQMAQAIQTFEQAAGQKNSFLSQKNKAD